MALSYPLESGPNDGSGHHLISMWDLIRKCHPTFGPYQPVLREPWHENLEIEIQPGISISYLFDIHFLCVDVIQIEIDELSLLLSQEKKNNRSFAEYCGVRTMLHCRCYRVCNGAAICWCLASWWIMNHQWSICEPTHWLLFSPVTTQHLMALPSALTIIHCDVYSWFGFDLSETNRAQSNAQLNQLECYHGNIQ